MERKGVKVIISCTVYNHERFLRRCLEGIAMQQTNFGFVAVVHDDASTDKSKTIIEEYASLYPDIIYPVYEEENLYSRKDGSLQERIDMCIDRFSPKYLAFCEGDDYWIDSNKLQDQVDLMEADDEISLCYTRSKSFSIRDNKIVNIRHTKCRDFRSFLLYDETITLTAMVNYNLYKRYIEEIQPHKRTWRMGDTPMWLWLSHFGKVAPVEKITAVYNAHEGSASRTGSYYEREAFNNNALEIRLFFINRYNECLDLIPFVKDKCYRSNMYDAYSFGKFKECFKYFFKIRKKELRDYRVIVQVLPRSIIRNCLNNQ